MTSCSIRGWALLVLLAIPASAGARTITVDLNGEGDHVDIQSAINAADGGDTVLVLPGQYLIQEPIWFPEEKSRVRVFSRAGPESTVIKMTEPTEVTEASVVIIQGRDFELIGFTLTGGGGWVMNPGGPAEFWEYSGGAVFIGGDTWCRIENCIMTNNSAVLGGAVYCAWGQATVINCSITRNGVDFLRPKPKEGGGVYCARGADLRLENCRITENEARAGGGLFFAEQV